MDDKKLYYKLEILYNKYIPICVAILLTLDNYFNIDQYYIHSFEYLFVPSIFTMLHMFITRIVFKFCIIHRVIVDYVFINIVFRIIDVTPFIPKINENIWIFIYSITLFICVIMIMYLYVSKRNFNQTAISK